MIKYTLLVDKKWYEKYSSSARTFGGKVVLTLNQREAKIITRKGDAEHRVGAIRYHMNADFVFPDLQRKYDLSIHPTIEVTELEV